MDEDFNLNRYKRKLIKDDIAASYGNNTFYSSEFKNPYITVQNCSRCQYPGSFAQNGLYVKGEQQYKTEPEYDRSMGQQIHYDKPYYNYMSFEAFKNTFDMNNMTIREQYGIEPRREYRNSKNGIRTIHGYRKPSSVDRDMFLEKEKRAESWYDF